MPYTVEYQNDVEIAKHSFDKHKITDDDIIKYIDIKSYNSKRIIKTASLSNYLDILKEQASEDNKNVKRHDNANYSMLEILTDDKVRMYFDIENIPRNNKEMIYEIIDKIYEIMQLKDRDTYNYTLTFNPNSHHEGLSYHLFIPVASTKKYIYNFIKLFNYRTDYKYVDMIDYRVYGKNRLFRTVGSRCPNKLNPFTPRRQEDYHKLIEGRLISSIIQNTSKLDLFFKCESSKILDDEFNKRINKLNNQFSEETIAKLITSTKYRDHRKLESIFNNQRNNQRFNNPRFNNPNFDNSLSLRQLNDIKGKLENELLLRQLDEIKDKLKDVLSNNKNKTKQLIRDQDNNRLIILMFAAVIVLMIANLFK